MDESEYSSATLSSSSTLLSSNSMSTEDDENLSRYNFSQSYNGLTLLTGYRHPSSPCVQEDAHGAFVVAKWCDEYYYRCCIFYDGAEIRFVYNDREEVNDQVDRLRERGWVPIREASDMYVTCHGMGLPESGRPFWKKTERGEVTR